MSFYHRLKVANLRSDYLLNHDARKSRWERYYTKFWTARLCITVLERQLRKKKKSVAGIRSRDPTTCIGFLTMFHLCDICQLQSKLEQYLQQYIWKAIWIQKPQRRNLLDVSRQSRQLHSKYGMLLRARSIKPLIVKPDLKCHFNYTC